MPFTITDGALRSVQDSPIAALGVGSTQGGVRLSNRRYADYASLYRYQPNVRTLVSFLARNIAQLGTHVFRRRADDDRVRLTDHPLARLLDQPNPWMTRYRSMVRLVSDLAIYDDAFWVKVRSDEQPLALVPVPPFMMSPAQGDRNWLQVERWELSGPTGRLTIPASEVIHFTGYDPADARTGFSPMETLRELLAEEFEAGRYREQMWRNGARTSGVITRPHDAPRWSEPARRRFKREWQDVYTGEGEDAGGTPILEDGMTYVPAGLEPKAAQYVEARKLTREEVAAAYHVPQPMVGILEHATYSNISEQHKMLYTDTLGPWLTMIQEELLLGLRNDLRGMTDVYVEFNIGEKLKGSFEEQATSISKLVGAPVLTRNEGRALLNRNAVDDGDELITPLNVVTGGLASPADTAPGDTAGPGPAPVPDEPKAAAPYLRAVSDDDTHK